MVNSELKHYGIEGMHWGVRRFQNPDGTLTSEGRKRYGISYNRHGAYVSDQNGKRIKSKTQKAFIKDMKKNDKELYKEYKYNERLSKSNRAIGIGSNEAIMASTVLNAANSANAKNGKQRCAEILSSYGNTYLSDLSKDKPKTEPKYNHEDDEEETKELIKEMLDSMDSSTPKEERDMIREIAKEYDLL